MELEIGEKDDFLLLACDGLFDVFPHQLAVDFILERMRKKV
jgi:serine/threonine protein phosphatase PrpC